MITDLGNEPSMEVNSNEIKFNISKEIRSERYLLTTHDWMEAWPKK